jgi:uncharacterized membrane protein HdeD (DUF308 family)
MTDENMLYQPERASLRQALGRNWLWLLLRGLVAILFGVLALVWPGATLLTLVLFYGAYMLVDGVFALMAGVMGRVSMTPRWWLILVGLLGVVVGVGTFLWPAVTVLVLIFFMAAWAVAIGVLQIIGAIQLRKEIEGEWILVLNGLLSVLFGAVLFAAPGAGALALVWIIGVFAILFGASMTVFALRMRPHAA